MQQKKWKSPNVQGHMSQRINQSAVDPLKPFGGLKKIKCWNKLPVHTGTSRWAINFRPCGWKQSSLSEPPCRRFFVADRHTRHPDTASLLKSLAPWETVFPLDQIFTWCSIRTAKTISTPDTRHHICCWPKQLKRKCNTLRGNPGLFLDTTAWPAKWRLRIEPRGYFDSGTSSLSCLVFSTGEPNTLLQGNHGQNVTLGVKICPTLLRIVLINSFIILLKCPYRMLECYIFLTGINQKAELCWQVTPCFEGYSHLHVLVTVLPPVALR